MKIALFLPNWIGDAVMATPALRALRQKFAAAEIVAVLRPSVADVLAGLDLVDRTIAHDPKGRNPELRGRRFVASLARERFNLAVLFPNSLRSAWIAWRAGAKRRVGFARDARRWLLTDALAPKPRSVPNPVLDEYLRLAAHLGCDVTNRQTEAAVVSRDEEELSRFWERYDPRWSEAGVVCLNPGGAFGAAKHWPVEHFADLARRLVDQLGRTVLVLCGPAEREEARQIVHLAGRERVVSLADFPTSIGLTKAAIERAELLVTTDSGPRHFARPFGVPVVTLFGPTHPAWSETFDPIAVHLQIPVDCGPCQLRRCPLEHHRCMRELSPERVFQAVVSQLSRTARRRVAA
jgi:heptosyltransferase II